MASKYLYMDKHFKLCCVQRDAQTQSGKYYVSIGDERHKSTGGRVYYSTVDEAQYVLDKLAKKEGWQNV